MAPLDVTATRVLRTDPERVRRLMFDPRHDPAWMAAVESVAAEGDTGVPGARAHRTGRFMGRTMRWTTEVVSAASNRLELRIVEGPMRGTIVYRLDPVDGGSLVTIRNTGEAPGLAPRWLIQWMMRRSLTADLERLARAVESS